eukprot:739552_1
MVRMHLKCFVLQNLIRMNPLHRLLQVNLRRPTELEYPVFYTTQNEAAMIVDDIVSNILEGSGVLGIVINLRESPDNISWIVLEGEDIVDAETTTTVLVDSYLPQIFEAIDVFVKTVSNDSTGVIQDQLYNIAGQLQQLIENLESTLQAADNVNNMAQSLVEYATLAASKALAASDVGETFNYETA